MKAVIQRVSKASITIDDQITAAIQNGLFILIGVEDADVKEDIDWLVAKIINLSSLHTGNSAPSNGEFECSNKLFNDICGLNKKMKTGLKPPAKEVVESWCVL